MVETRFLDLLLEQLRACNLASTKMARKMRFDCPNMLWKRWLMSRVYRKQMKEDEKMPRWTPKDKRQYEHIKSSSLENGMSEDTAEEIAARTVNKHRRQEGRTPNKTTQGTGNPNLSLEERSVEELRNMASQLKIPGRSKMRKSQLVDSISQKR